MYLLFKRPAALLLFIALTLVLAARGIVPALSKVDTDFPNYFTAAKIVADGGNTDRLYDNGWFQDQMRRYQIGKASEGEFKPFPPPTALLLVPLARLKPLDALRVVTGVSVLCLVCSIILLTKILSWSLVDSTVFVLLSGYAVLGALRLGQPYILVSLSCILGYYAHLKGRSSLAGMCFGLFTPVKYFPIVILVYFAFRKEWKVVLGGAAAILTVTAVSIGVLGWKIHEDFLSSVLGNHLIAKLDLQDPFTARYQSFDSLFRRLFIYDATRNPQPLYALPRLQGIAVSITKASILLAAISTLVKLARRGADSATAPSIGILGVVTLLLAPATATYHFVLLWLPVGLLINYFVRRGARVRAYFILGAYALIGFFPYRYTIPFEGRGGLTVLAYPRLFLLLAMFVACVHFIWSQAEPAVEGRKQDSAAMVN
ncbi:MAG TPA: glycosyltransferase family 87 protein [Steroidobacteraceae bacterium]|nr:glycosyltransferase family 87 protein [Steroidobacteraceae bacterium]